MIILMDSCHDVLLYTPFEWKMLIHLMWSVRLIMAYIYIYIYIYIWFGIQMEIPSPPSPTLPT
jgi:hypothetical protein